MQVRIFSPGLGVLKGMLTLKEGIDKIQYPAPGIRQTAGFWGCLWGAGNANQARNRVQP